MFDDFLVYIKSVLTMVTSKLKLCNLNRSVFYSLNMGIESPPDLAWDEDLNVSKRHEAGNTYSRGKGHHLSVDVVGRRTTTLNMVWPLQLAVKEHMQGFLVAGCLQPHLFPLTLRSLRCGSVNSSVDSMRA